MPYILPLWSQITKKTLFYTYLRLSRLGFEHSAWYYDTAAPLEQVEFIKRYGSWLYISRLIFASLGWNEEWKVICKSFANMFITFVLCHVISICLISNQVLIWASVQWVSAHKSIFSENITINQSHLPINRNQTKHWFTV